MKLKPENTYDTPDVKSESKNDSNKAILIVIGCLCLVGLGYYHFVFKPKKAEKAAKLKRKDED